METVVLENDGEEANQSLNGSKINNNLYFKNLSAIKMAAIAAVAQQTQPEAACRLKLLRIEMIEENIPKGAQLSDLSCAVNVKEKVDINGWF